jgi:hypothetical protein
LWRWIKTGFLLVCGAEGEIHARRGKESRLGGRLAVKRACWRLLCVVEKGSLTGVDREI